MKKLILKKANYEPVKRIGYKIDYERELNAAQYEAVMHNEGAALVIAGAGTGKTRALIYRVARLVEDRVPPEAILLLTFTRKAAAEALRRASLLLDGRCQKVSGGTYHSFALHMLRRYSQLMGVATNFSIIDQSDSEDVINLLRSNKKLDRSKRRFPQKQTLRNIFSLSINRRVGVEDVVENDYPFYIENVDEIRELFVEYSSYKLKHNILDYDDLLLFLLELCKEYPKARSEMNRRFRYLMIDEYQDTNKLQHELALQLAGDEENILAVGDDAQSIYSFRGAHFDNILFYPKSFEECAVYKIEENYRSTQPILTLANKLIEAAAFRYEKNLFTRRTGGEIPILVAAKDDSMQSKFVTQQIIEFREQDIPLQDIAVLARSSYHTFDLELELNKANIPFRKFGGMKFVETAHIKDLLSLMRVMHNPKDAVSWQRSLLLLDGVGPASARKIVDLIAENSLSFNNLNPLNELKRGKKKIRELFEYLAETRREGLSAGELAKTLYEIYRPLMKNKYEDWQRRETEIDVFLAIAAKYTNLQDFFNDMAVDPPIEGVLDLEPESRENEYLTISTIHSAKGLEWKAVFIVWAVEGRFPSARAVNSIDSLEEERRLFYVAATRAKDYIFITYPLEHFDREAGCVLSKPSRFIYGIDEDVLEKCIVEEED